MGGTLKKVLRWTGLVLLGALLLLAGFLVLLNTSWGLEIVKKRVLAQIGPLVNGRIEIDRLDGSLLGSLALHGIRLSDENGTPILTVDGLRVEFDLLPLFSRRLRLADVALSRPRLWLVEDPSGLFNVQKLIAARSGDPEPDGPPSTWRIHIRRLSVLDGQANLVRPGKEEVNLDELDLVASGAMSPDAVEARLIHLSAVWTGTGMPIGLRGRVHLKESGLAIQGLDARLAKSKLEMAGMEVSLDGDRLSGTFQARLAQDDLTRLSRLELKTDLLLQGRFDKEPGQADLRVGVLAQAGLARLDLSARLDPRSRHIRLALDGQHIDPRALAGGLPGGLFDLDLSASLNGLALEEASGQFNSRAHGAIAGVEINKAVLQGSLQQGHLAFTLQLGLPGGQVQLRAGMRPFQQPLVVQNGKIELQVDDLSAAMPRVAGLSGQAQMNLDLAGSLGRMQATGDVHVSALRLGDFGLDEARGRLRLGGALLQPSGSLMLNVRGLRLGDLELKRLGSTIQADDSGRRITWQFDTRSPDGRCGLKGRVSAQRTQDGFAGRLERLDLSVNRIAWSGNARRVDWYFQRGLIIQDLVLASAIGKLELGAGWNAAGHGSIDLGIQQLDLARVSDLLARDPVSGLAGRIDLQLRAERWPGRLSGNFRAHATGVSVPAIPQPLDANLDAAFHSGQVAVSMTVDAGQHGQLKAAAQLVPPTAMDDPAAWRKIAPTAVRRVDVTLGVADLAGWARLAGLPAPEGGRLDLTAHAVPADGRLELDLGVDPFRLHGLQAELSGDFRLRLDPQRTRGSVVVRQDHVDRLRGDLDLDAGFEQLARADWESFASAPLAGRLQLDEVPLQRAAEALGIDLDLSGTITAGAHLTGTPRRPDVQAHLDLAGLVVAGVAAGGLQARGTWAAGEFQGRADFAQPEGGRLFLQVRGKTQPVRDLWLRLAAEGFRLGPYSRIARGRLAPVLDFDGILDAQLQLQQAGSRWGPDGWLHLDSGRLQLDAGLAPLDQVRVSGRFGSDHASLDLTANAGMGKLSLSADASLAGGRPGLASVDLSLLHFPLPVAGWVVGADAAVKNRIQPVPGGVRIDSQVTQAVVRLPEDKQQDLHPSGAMADVVFLDREPAGAGEPGPSGDREDAFALTILARAPGTIRVLDEQVQAQLGADLQIELSGGRASVRGQVLVEQGRVILFDRPYDIVVARASLGGRQPPDPDLEVVLEHDFGSVQVQVVVSGSASRPEVALRSRPAGYSQAQLLAFVLGRPPGDEREAQGTLSEQALSIASTLLLSKVTASLKRVLPIDTLKLDQEEQSGTTSTRLTVGRWLSDDLFVAYRYRNGATEMDNVNEAQVEYRLGRDWILEALYGDRGAGSLDVLWIQRF